MLEPWILEKGALKKKLYLGLILNNLLKKASVLHAITPLEKNNLFKLTNHKKIVEIPNLFDFNFVLSALFREVSPCGWIHSNGVVAFTSELETC